MKILLLDGCIQPTEPVHQITASFEDMAKKNSWDFEEIPLRELNIAPCRGCFDCWLKTPGQCTIEDDAREVTRKMINSEVVIYLTPIVFGAYSFLLKAQLDRSISLIHPYFTQIDGEYHHRKRYEKYPHLVGIGLLESEDKEIEGLFHENIQRNSLNLHAPSSRSYVIYTGGRKEEAQSHIENIALAMGEIP